MNNQCKSKTVFFPSNNVVVMKTRLEYLIEPRFQFGYPHSMDALNIKIFSGNLAFIAFWLVENGVNLHVIGHREKRKT